MIRQMGIAIAVVGALSASASAQQINHSEMEQSRQRILSVQREAERTTVEARIALREVRARAEAQAERQVLAPVASPNALLKQEAR